MGVNWKWKRECRRDWFEDYGPDSRADDRARLERHVGWKIDGAAWQIEDDAYPQVGSYLAYGGFREALKSALLPVPRAARFLGTGDSDTIYIPLSFVTPFAYDDRYVASLPGVIAALEAFAVGLGFDFSSEDDPEFNNGEWLPVATAKNVARIVHNFFIEKQDACVVLS